MVAAVREAGIAAVIAKAEAVNLDVEVVVVAVDTAAVVAAPIATCMEEMSETAC